MSFKIISSIINTTRQHKESDLKVKSQIRSVLHL